MSSVNECLINLFVERFMGKNGAKPTKDIQQGLRRRLLGGWLGDMQCNAVTNEMECVILPHPNAKPVFIASVIYSEDADQIMSLPRGAPPPTP